MSSANLVSVTYTPETAYGEKPTPISGVTLETARFTAEALSGTPTTTESAAIRTDRMSGGLVTTGLEVGGNLDFELSTGTFFNDFFAAGMMTTWVAQELQNSIIELIPDPADDQRADLNTTTGDFDTIGPGVVVGDVLQLIPVSGSPVVVQVIQYNTNTNLIVATKRGEAAIGPTAYDVAIPAHLVIGQIQPSFVIGKAYTDVTHDVSTDQHSQSYLGSIVSGFSIAATYGEIVTGSYITSANGYEQEPGPSYEQQVVAGGGTVNPAETSNPLNASVDVPLVTTGQVTLASTTYCIESFSIDFDNSVTPQNCIGLIAPTKYDLGRAAINISATIYLSDSSYDDFMPAKLTQEPIGMLFTMENSDGGWAFSLPAVQLSFPDPAATGADEQTQLDATGVAKVGENGESALKIYQLVGDI